MKTIPGVPEEVAAGEPRRSPVHVGIILDGHRRWARAHGLAAGRPLPHWSAARSSGYRVMGDEISALPEPEQQPADSLRSSMKSCKPVSIRPRRILFPRRGDVNEATHRFRVSRAGFVLSRDGRTTRRRVSGYSCGAGRSRQCLCRVRHRTTGGIAAAILAAALLAGAPAAHADTTLLDCSGADEANWDPGLTLETQSNVELTASDDYAACGGSSSTAATLPTASCLSITMPGYTETVNWSTGSSPTYSNITYTTTDSNRTPFALIVVTVGTVTSGRYSGALVQKTVVLPNTELLACLSPGGITEADGLANLLIVDV